MKVEYESDKKVVALKTLKPGDVFRYENKHLGGAFIFLSASRDNDRVTVFSCRSHGFTAQPGGLKVVKLDTTLVIHGDA